MQVHESGDKTSKLLDKYLNKYYYGATESTQMSTKQLTEVESCLGVLGVWLCAIADRYGCLFGIPAWMSKAAFPPDGV